MQRSSWIPRKRLPKQGKLRVGRVAGDDRKRATHRGHIYIYDPDSTEVALVRRETFGSNIRPALNAYGAGDQELGAMAPDPGRRR